jgi:hypothetical protein
MILISITVFVCFIGTLAFIMWYSPKKIDYYVTYPYTLGLHKGEPEEDSDDFADDLLNKLTKGDKKMDTGSKYFNMRISINLNDVMDYAEWTVSKFEDEKVYANATNIRFYDGTEMVINVPFDYFDADFTTYLKATR